MPKKRSRRSPYKSCANKKRYNSRKEAEEIADLIEDYDEEAELRVYRCSFCQGFHLTSLE